MGFRLRFSLNPIQWFTSQNANLHIPDPPDFRQKAGWRPLRSTAPGGPSAPNVSPVPHSVPPTARRSCCGWTPLGYNPKTEPRRLTGDMSHQTWRINQKKWLVLVHGVYFHQLRSFWGKKLHVFIWCEPRNQKKHSQFLHGSSWCAKRAKAHVRVDDGRQAVGDGHGGQGPPKGLIQGIQCGLAIHWWNCWRQIDSGWLVDGWPTALKNDGVKVSWDDDIPKMMVKIIHQQTFRVGVAKKRMSEAGNNRTHVANLVEVQTHSLLTKAMPSCHVPQPAPCARIRCPRLKWLHPTARPWVSLPRPVQWPPAAADHPTGFHLAQGVVSWWALVVELLETHDFLNCSRTISHSNPLPRWSVS